MDERESSESPIEAKKTKSKTPRKPKEIVLKQKSPVEYFAENKNIAGFDNPRKSLYTTVTELVENALDSAESISELPVVEIIEEIKKSKFNSMIGLVDHERVDAALYDDYETEKAREKRLANEALAQEIQAKNATLGKKVKEVSASKDIKGRGEASFYRVTCKDNGKGVPHDDIPNMFGRGIFLVYIYMRNGIARNIGMKLKFKLSLKGSGQLTVYTREAKFRQAKFDDPSGQCLSPVGEYNLRLVIIKELNPDMVATYSGRLWLTSKFCLIFLLPQIWNFYYS
ncbi:hypothetical protein RIF29_05759 [Crotalaria pallida]|uniref:Histidine kinase/HSP90-like ATPase domain-containing protein n=1 Tax=Crotalaria pallida TaxID=3830 RepID=A0AAN9J2E2_CROPI